MSTESRFMGLEINRRSVFAGLGLAGVTATASGLLLASPAHALTATQVQRSLWGLYYYSGAIDGVLGTVSKTAIRAFQTDRRLVVDGVAGSITQGEISRVVRQIQAKRGLVQDADYGPVTVASIKKFQASKGLVQDGRSGPKTMSALGVQRVLPSTSSGKLVAISQMSTGAQGKWNCGPCSCVVSLVAIGKPPAGYVSSPTGNSAVVARMRTATGVASGSTDILQLQSALHKYGARTEFLSAAADGYEKGIQRARAGATVILNVSQGLLQGRALGTEDGHYVVARGVDSSGRILVSDSAHWTSAKGTHGAVVPYTVTQLRNGRHRKAGLRRALVVKA